MLTQVELEAIRERTEKAKIGNPLRDVDALVRKEEVINEDVPKLLAEIERLRTQNLDLLEWNRYYLAENKRLKRGGDNE